MSTYILIMRNGHRVKIPYSTVNGKEYVTTHFSRAELDTGHDEEAMFFKPILDVIEAVRNKIGGPVVASSGYRSRPKQERLYNDYLEECKRKGIQPVPGKVSKPGNSPHETGAAVDLIVPVDEGYEAKELAKLLQKTSVELGYPMARVGWEAYLGQGFIHVDLAFMLFDPYLDAKNPFPQAWSPGVTW